MALLIEDSTKPKSHVSTLQKVIILLFLIIVALSVLFILYKQNIFFSDNQVGEGEEARSNPLGLLFLSLALVSQEDNVTALSPMLFDLTQRMLTPIPVIENNNLAYETFQYAMSFNSQRITFLGLLIDTENPSSPKDESYGSSWSIFRSNIGDTKEYAEIETILNSTTLTEKFDPSDEDYFRQLPAISDEGVVIYSALQKSQFDAAKSQVDTIPADDWSVYVIDKFGVKSKLTEGLKPKWINSSIFAYLKNDGVHVYNTKTFKDALLVETDGVATSVDGLDVSNDEKYLALTTPKSGKVTIIRLSEWLNESKTPATVVSAIASNPVFSPDNKYLALVVVKGGNTSVGSNARAHLEFFSLENFQFVPDPLEFSKTVVDGIYLTDWQ